jgi:transcriptional regulator with XRE-family HTH domain
MYFKENIKYLRETKNLTQKQIGELIGVRSNTVSHYETGVSQPDYDKLLKISKVFGVTIQDLLSIDIKNKSFQSQDLLQKDQKSDIQVVPNPVPNSFITSEYKDQAFDNSFFNDPEWKDPEALKKAGRSVAVQFFPSFLHDSTEENPDPKFFKVNNDFMAPVLSAGEWAGGEKTNLNSLSVNELAVIHTAESYVMGKVTYDQVQGYIIVAFEQSQARPVLIRAEDVVAVWRISLRCTRVGT